MLQHFSLPRGHRLQTQAAPIGSSVAPLNEFDYARAITLVDQDVVHIIAQAFVDHWPQEREKMRSSVALPDMQALLHVAHALKGTLAMFGAQPASVLASEIEQCANHQDAAGAGVRLGLLELEMEKLIPVIPLDGQTD